MLNENRGSIPSKKDCIKAFGQEKGQELHKILRYRDSEWILEKYKQAQTYRLQCYHEPSLALIKLYAANELLEMHGIEGIVYPGQHQDGFSYCNSGDSYLVTLGYDSEEEQFLITCVGDFVEAWEKEHGGSIYGDEAPKE